MKNLLIPLVYLLLVRELSGQTLSFLNENIHCEQFLNYLQELAPVNLPFICSNELDRDDTFSKLLCKKNNVIKPEYINKFILSDSVDVYDTLKCEYRNGLIVGIKSNNKFIIVIYAHEIFYPPEDEESDYIYQKILTTYDFNGKIISSLVLRNESMKRDGKSIISEDLNIEVKSFLIDDQKSTEKKTVNVLLKKEHYAIDENGIIKKTKKDLIKKEIFNIYADSINRLLEEF